VLPALGLVALLPKHEFWRQVALLAFLPLISLVFITSDLYSPSLSYLIGYGLMVGLGVGLWITRRFSLRTPNQAAQRALGDELPGT